MAGRKRWFLIVTGVFAALVIVVALWIMVRGAGLQESLDFGAGAYYYADIPDFEKYTEAASLPTRIPYLVYVGLFLLWGWLMYRLWKRIDK
ncbi:MAG: hypothetical protein J6O01_01530 [Bacteroidales bacterium]|jgi:hypothetical protein|nr:hypothetical protein [Bacteroidales bacterium]MBQ9818693.1 hypothetical protein [Bacteroidales bacterium]